MATVRRHGPESTSFGPVSAPPPPWVRRRKLSPETGRLLLPSMGDLGVGQWSSRTGLCSVSTAEAGSSGRRVSRRFSPTKVFATSQNGVARARPSARPRGRHPERRGSGSRPPRPALRVDARRRCRSSPRRGDRCCVARASSKGRPQERGCKRHGRDRRDHTGRGSPPAMCVIAVDGTPPQIGSALGSLTRVGTRVSVRSD